jgi:hypothetical protein
MSSSNDIGNRVLLAKIGLMLGNPGLGAERAGKLAARQIARELRTERQRQARQTSSNSPLSLSNAVSSLINKIATIGQRYIDRSEPREPREPPHTSYPISSGPPVSNVVVRKAADNTSLVGVWGAGPSGAQLIPDSEFAPRFHDRSQWRQQINRLAEIEAERRALWRERLAALKAKGLLQ